AGDLAGRADPRSALDLDERPHARVVADTAAVEVRERPDGYVFAEFHVGDEAMRGVIGGSSRHGGDATQSWASPANPSSGCEHAVVWPFQPTASPPPH